ncbi:phosphatidate cytidylyltransferase [Stackebrandtia albiflava]|uniref:Phosphatidate cytidylyltransferase n=1 Tax=Stackebrandtia albiflava TaxID=406432 RepID=A0A562VAF5_9ACTN|nr:phosphatidate cytidylyltransferase [Stackebrandtia albiflava]TWJ14862.1 phosphatidate cytidylyltransferase [Stackebrandtia albiflava]
MNRHDTPPAGSPRRRFAAPGEAGPRGPEGHEGDHYDPAPPPPGEPAADGTVSDPAEPPATRPSRAGRNLPVAIGVGLGLGALVLASLLIYRQVFLIVVVLAVAVGIWELATAMRKADIRVPVWPLVGCGVGMLALTWFAGAPMLVVGLGVTVAFLVVWRLADGATGYHVDVPAATLVATYIPFLGGFAVLMVVPDDGHLRIIVTLAVVVLSDTGGYVAGVLFGRHPMAPRISPKKSWEGMAGSLAACAIGGAVLLWVTFDVAWWQGALFGVTLAVAATLGDLTESLMKRDLGVKDMSNLIPGHGGLMDRLDSILLVLPVAYAWLAYLAPVSA